MLVYVKNNTVIAIFPAEDIISKLIQFPEIKLVDAPEFVRIGWYYNSDFNKFSQDNPNK